MVEGLSGITLRVKKVEILSKELLGVIDADWIDTDPWVRIQIPAGQLLEQHLLGPHVEGEIHTINYTSLKELLYDTVIPENPSHYPIDADNTKWKFSTAGTEFYITLEDVEGTEQVFSFTNVRIMTIKLVKTNTTGLREGLWQIRFMSDQVNPVEKIE